MRAFLGALRRDRRAWAAGVVAVVLLSAALVVIGLRTADDPKAAAPPTATPTATRTPTSTPSPTPSPTPVKWTGILDGSPMTDEEWEARKELLPLAVMIDNTPGGYPQAGLDEADLVYEAFVEGGITRFMAVFWRQQADLILPVRSARTPFVIWVDELGALYGHAGSADTDNEADAAGQLAAWNIFDLNAFTPGPSTAYYRDGDRYAPYNLATSTQWLREAAARAGYASQPRVEPWIFKDDNEGTAGLPQAAAIQVSFQERLVAWQTVQWRWDEASRSYLRFQFGGPAVDAATNEQLHARNVVVMRVPWAVADANGHVLLEQFGSGEATVFLDGKAIAGTWKKDDRQGRTRFYDAAGNEIAFDRGPIWIEVVGPQSDIIVAATGDELPALPPYVPPPPGAIPETPDEPTPVPEPSPTPTATPTEAGETTPTATLSPTEEPATSTATPSTAPATSTATAEASASPAGS